MLSAVKGALGRLPSSRRAPSRHRPGVARGTSGSSPGLRPGIHSLIWGRHFWAAIHNWPLGPQVAAACPALSVHCRRRTPIWWTSARTSSPQSAQRPHNPYSTLHWHIVPRHDGDGLWLLDNTGEPRSRRDPGESWVPDRGLRWSGKGVQGRARSGSPVGSNTVGLARFDACSVRAVERSGRRTSSPCTGGMAFNQPRYVDAVINRRDHELQWLWLVDSACVLGEDVHGAAKTAMRHRCRPHTDIVGTVRIERGIGDAAATQVPPVGVHVNVTPSGTTVATYNDVAESPRSRSHLDTFGVKESTPSVAAGGRHAALLSARCAHGRTQNSPKTFRLLYASQVAPTRVTKDHGEATSHATWSTNDA